MSAELTIDITRLIPHFERRISAWGNFWTMIDPSPVSDPYNWIQLDVLASTPERALEEFRRRIEHSHLARDLDMRGA